MNKEKKSSIFLIVTLALTGFSWQTAFAVTAEVWPDLDHAIEQYQDDGFYTPPEVLPPGNPGDVIRYRAAPASPLIKVGIGSITAYQVMYLSTDAQGAATAVTGTVILPAGANGSTPIVGLGPGTQGMADFCAPSKGFSATLEYDLVYVRSALKRGWAVAVTDYQGLGTPGDHTYVVGRILGPNVIDSVRAAQRLDVAQLSSYAKVGFWGYSEGGGAVAWATELQPVYAPEMNLVGTAAGGIPADLHKLADVQDGNIGFVTIMMAAMGFNQAYPELDLESYLNDYGKRSVESLRNQCIYTAVPLYMFQRMEYFLKDKNIKVFEIPSIKARADQNTLGSMPPAVPMFQYHATLDEAVDYGQAKDLRIRYCDAGVRLQWKAYLGEHLTGFLSGQMDAVNWLQDRFDDRSAAENCPKWWQWWLR